jgi:hypothetical protein
MVTVFDGDGLVVDISQVAGNGALEEIVLPAGNTAAVVRVDRQTGTTHGSGLYRLEVAPTAGFQVAPEAPLAPNARTMLASSTGDGCHPQRQPPPRVKYSNP